MGHSRWRPGAVAAAFAAVAALYASALNPWYLPEQYDDVMYHEAAKEVAAEGCFCFHGLVLGDWGPGLPVVLAGPVALGLDGVLAAKTVVVVFVLAAFVLGLRLLARDDRPWPLPAMLLSALAPSAFLAGTRVMSDWPYAALAFGFLLALSRMREDRGPWPAVAGGLLLAAAVLTRFAGVTLMAAAGAQAIGFLRRERRMRAAFPELVSGGIGMAAFAAWRAYVAIRDAQGLAVIDYLEGAGWLAHFDAAALLLGPADAPTHIVRVAASLGLPEAPVVVAAAAIAGLMFVGLASRLRRGHGSPPDAWVVATVLLYATFEAKHTRYLLPVAPFLVAWLFEGARAVAASFRRPQPPRLAFAARTAVGLWVAILVAMDAALLVRGNGRTHNGLSPLASPTAETFYAGYWRDLWSAAQEVRDGGHGSPVPVALLGRLGNERSVFAFSGRRCLTWPTPEAVSHLLVVAPAAPGPEEMEAAGLVEVARHGSLTVYRVRAGRQAAGGQ